MEKHVSRAVKGKSMKKKVEPETLEEHIVAGGALMFVRVWHVARVRLRARQTRSLTQHTSAQAHSLARAGLSAAPNATSSSRLLMRCHAGSILVEAKCASGRVRMSTSAEYAATLRSDGASRPGESRGIVRLMVSARIIGQCSMMIHGVRRARGEKPRKESRRLVIGLCHDEQGGAMAP